MRVVVSCCGLGAFWSCLPCDEAAALPRLRRSFYAGKPETGQPLAAALAIAGCNAAGLTAGDDRPISFGNASDPAVAGAEPRASGLSRAGPGEAQCELLILNKSPKDKEPGWGARDIEAAYNLPSSTKGAGQIVAIIDAYDNPNVASDLAAYRRHYGLPKAKFYKYNQDGQQSHYPKPT